MNEGPLYRTLPVDLICRGRWQPRQDFGQAELDALAKSIAKHGVIQPVVVTPTGEGSYELISGERRWRASQLAGLQDIPAIVRDYGEQQTASIAIVANKQSEGLNPIEEALAYRRILKEYPDMTHGQLAEDLGTKRESLTNLMRLLHLPAETQALLRRGELTQGHGKALVALNPSQQNILARRTVREGWSVRELEERVRKLLGQSKQKARNTDPDMRRLEGSISERLGNKVTLNKRASGQWVMQITFHSDEELEGLVERLQR